MKLSKLYSNQPNLFEPVEFTPDLNVVLGEIRLPQNRQKDTHNLGKTTLGRLIDFCFLLGKDNKFFLFKDLDLFGKFVFFLEVELNDGSYLTVRRSVEDATKCSFKKHVARNQDFSTLPVAQWDHESLPFERARELLDSLLDWRDLKPWTYRKIIGYLLRSQDDYGNVFQLQKFASAHVDWKPFLAHLLGFNGDLVEKHYRKQAELDKKQANIVTIEKELGGSIEDISKIEGILLLKQRDAEKKQRLLDAFDFASEEKGWDKQLVDEIDNRIATLNNQRYALNQNRKKIIDSLEEDQILFDPDAAQSLFREAGVLFSGQLKRDYQQLIDFNKAITEERREYLQEERTEIETELRRVNAELNRLNKERVDRLSVLRGSDVFIKYRELSDELVTLRVDINTLERQRVFLRRLQELRNDIRQLTEDKAHIQAQIENDVEKQNSDSQSLFSTIRVYFNEIVYEVIDRNALLTVAPNQQGYLEFKTDILDDTGNATSADRGFTYRKLLCVAFDMAVLRAYIGEKFPCFAFHDGVFESLDDRKKENLLAVIRRYTDLGLQQIITLIDSDMPERETDASPVFEQDEIVLLLHDENEQGRLFKIQSW